jgi:hypothetical protein
MNKLTVGVIAILALSLSQCKTFVQKVDAPSPSHSEPIRMIPSFGEWRLGESLTSSNGSASIAIHLVQFTSSRVFFVYSVFDSKAALTKDDLIFQVIDPLGELHTAESHTLLSQSDQFQVRVAAFKTGAFARDAQLSIQTGKGEVMPPIQALVANTLAGVSPSNFTVILLRSGYGDQENYRVSTSGGAFKVDLAATAAASKPMTEAEVLAENKAKALAGTKEPPRGDIAATPSPVPIDPSTVALSGGQDVKGDATLRIENTKSGSVDYLHIVFFELDAPNAELLK